MTIEAAAISVIICVCVVYEGSLTVTPYGDDELSTDNPTVPSLMTREGVSVVAAYVGCVKSITLLANIGVYMIYTI